MIGILVVSMGLNFQLKLIFKEGKEKCTEHLSTSPLLWNPIRLHLRLTAFVVRVNHNRSWCCYLNAPYTLILSLEVEGWWSVQCKAPPGAGSDFKLLGVPRGTQQRTRHIQVLWSCADSKNCQPESNARPTQFHSNNTNCLAASIEQICFSSA